MDTDSIFEMEARVATRAAETTDSELEAREEELRADRRRRAESMAGLGDELAEHGVPTPRVARSADAIESFLSLRPARVRSRRSRARESRRFA